ncbi:MAG: ribosome recycling factor [Thermodesulfobacteriota bacterium]
MTGTILKDTKGSMDKVIDLFHSELGKVRTGRVSLSILDSVRVECYGAMMPINQVATMSVPESRMITIQPWDPKVIGDIEKAILKSDIGLTPSNDGKIIRINIPDLTEERRLDLVKLTKRIAEEKRVAVRNVRRETNEELKTLEKDKNISKDDLHRYQTEVQEITDKYISKIEEILKHKEQEIMEV